MAQEAERSEHTVSTRAMEIVVSGLFVAAACLVMYDNWRIGARWGEDGPQAGYFPFYIGVIICVASVINLVTALGARAKEAGDKPFVTREQLRMVLIVMVPYSLYVVLISNPVYSLGIYEASVVYIALFMRYLGKYTWLKIGVISVATMVAFFLMFEVWFKVPLPKGPIEALLGFQ